MAELINLQQADKWLAMTLDDIKALHAKLGGSEGKVWSKEQLDTLGIMFGAIQKLDAALRAVMHNNRDGRGTQQAPPKK